VRNLYELYIDVTEYYGDAIRGQMRQMSGPTILRDGLSQFRFEGVEEIRDRFMNSMSRVGCV
jgi:formylmethanofuran dehydrogenase subunit C